MAHGSPFQSIVHSETVHRTMSPPSPAMSKVDTRPHLNQGCATSKITTEQNVTKGARCKLTSYLHWQSMKYTATKKIRKQRLCSDFTVGSILT